MAKKTKKEKAKVAAQKAELARIEAEKAKIQMVVDERERLLQDRVMLVEKARQEDVVHEERRRQLQETATMLADIEDEYGAKLRADLCKQEWEQFMKCDRLPDPSSPSQMNTYLYVWRETDRLNNIEDATTKTSEVLKLLDALGDLIEAPPPNAAKKKVDLWIEMRDLVRAEQQRHLDAAAYRLLRRLESDLEAESLEIVRYYKACEHFKLCLWAQLMLPVASFKPDDDTRPAIQCEFSQLGVSMQLPKSLNDIPLAVRAMWVQYDHYSDRCPSYHCAELPASQRLDMLDAAEEECSVQASLREEITADLERRLAVVERLVKEVQARPPPGTESKDKPPPPPSPELDNYEAGEPIKSPSQMMNVKDGERERGLRAELRMRLAPHEVNLREMAVLGGTLHLDLALQPPQPRDMRTRLTITVLEGAHTLQPVPYHQPYQPPAPPEPGQVRLPEEIEAELKQAERELEALVLINILLPETLLWFEPPTVVGWDEEKGFWTTEDYHDIKFNEEKQLLTFRAGRMRPLGLAVHRYTNLPYQGWEVKPDTKSAPSGAAPSAVILSITAAVVMVELCIRDSEMCLNQLQNGPNNALLDLVGKFMKPRELFKLLRDGGLDLCPGDDAGCYLEGMAPKHRPTERHLYHTMALLSNTYNFTWSRWNQQAGTRNVVMQFREYIDRKKVGNFNMLLVTPSHATIPDCTEVSPQFNTKSAEGLPFYADLFHLVQDHCSLLTKTRIEEIPFTFVETMYDVLRAVRLLSSS
ncbi:axonemal 84 kDa protein [Thrips palmi]|uniref:Axonemal 84 kDa protein n=1 Tax=Thrips palmi TaxID=161013 RepID=A0A6P8ZU06_THRPL|nr:axonemal 84 kDa protein [Thrips palmi]